MLQDQYIVRLGSIIPVGKISERFLFDHPLLARQRLYVIGKGFVGHALDGSLVLVPAGLQNIHQLRFAANIVPKELRFFAAQLAGIANIPVIDALIADKAARCVRVVLNVRTVVRIDWLRLRLTATHTQ